MCSGIRVFTAGVRVFNVLCWLEVGYYRGSSLGWTMGYYRGKSVFSVGITVCLSYGVAWKMGCYRLGWKMGYYKGKSV